MASGDHSAPPLLAEAAPVRDADPAQPVRASARRSSGTRGPAPRTSAGPRVREALAVFDLACRSSRWNAKSIFGGYLLDPSTLRSMH